MGGRGPCIPGGSAPPRRRRLWPVPGPPAAQAEARRLRRKTFLCSIFRYTVPIRSRLVLWFSVNLCHGKFARLFKNCRAIFIAVFQCAEGREGGIGLCCATMQGRRGVETPVILFKKKDHCHYAGQGTRQGDPTSN